MRRILFALPLLLVGFGGGAIGFGVPTAVHASTCTPTGFFRDNINMTAALINPSGTVHGNVDATGCNIGVYYGPGSSGTVNGANVYGANYFGIVNNGGSVTIMHSTVHNIGEVPFNGDQHGVGIYFAFGAPSSGSIDHNTVYAYQKGGIVVNGTSSPVSIDHNTVTGNGPVDYIAQNGIQVGYGAQASVSHNTVSDNSYTGPNFASDGGILLVGGDCYGGPFTMNVTVDHNTVTNNDVGVYLSNLEADCVSPAATPTDNVVSHNVISDDAVTNTTGYGTGGYQAGISDQGDGDVLDHNVISGVGYTPVSTPPPYLYFIDDTDTNNVVEAHNVTH